MRIRKKPEFLLTSFSYFTSQKEEVAVSIMLKSILFIAICVVVISECSTLEESGHKRKGRQADGIDSMNPPMNQMAKALMDAAKVAIEIAHKKMQMIMQTFKGPTMGGAQTSAGMNPADESASK